MVIPSGDPRRPRSAASIGQCSFMRTGWEAVRFGAVKYIVPFFFVYNPALVAQDANLLQILVVFAGAILGVIVLSYALQGYLPGVGSLKNRVPGLVVRGLLVTAGILLTAPELVSSLIEDRDHRRHLRCLVQGPPRPEGSSCPYGSRGLSSSNASRFAPKSARKCLR